MAIRTPSLAQIERLAALEKLPDTARVCTADAALMAGVAVSTWERMRREGKTPPATKVNDRALSYTVGHIRARHAARTEQTACWGGER
jgi:hypothetical protein